MSLYSQFKTDTSLEKSGILLDYGLNKRTSTPDAPKRITLRVARAGGANAAYDKLLDAKVKPHRRAIQNERFERDDSNEIMREVYARTVVLGWENVDIEASANGPEILDAKFTVENCIRLFTDLPDLFDDVQVQCQKASLFRADIREIEAKN